MTSENIKTLPRSLKVRRATKRTKNGPGQGQDFSLINFLEIEKSRLKKLQYLFGEKLPQSNQLTSQQGLYEKQCEHRNQLRKRLIRIMADEDSSFQKHLRKFFQQTFL